ncbi:APC family permease [Paenibacillus lutrae]|uniref:Amino acid permease n=1 Tax=Paenibacillus lutrae TaxID=2078573 RepID=A0A7X3FH14_9BACL|nr:APC family permease [Paenibacillus lutrae]MVO99471.1 amino acid permease [Paenibacillus lutrae]
MNRPVELQRTLKLWHIVVIGLGYMAPMAVFDTYGIVSAETGGHVPAAYALTLLAILFTASSYGKMVRVYPNAGSAYAYTRNTIHPYAGFLVGWAALLDYLFLPMINALLTGIYLSAVFPGIPEWIWIVGFVLFITVLNLLKIKITASVNTFLVLFQIVVVLLFAALAVRGLMNGDGLGQVFSAQPFYGPDLSLPALLVGASILCFAFLGFDAVSTLTEETVDPVKNTPRAIILVAMLGGILFMTASYFTQSLFPDTSVFEDPEAASSEIALFIGGKVFQLVFLAAALSSTLASGLVSLTSVTRLLYAMGRDHYLPKKIFGYVHPKYGTPVYNVLIIGCLSLTALKLDLVTATSFINFGALIAFTFVNLNVIIHYVFKKKQRSAVDYVRYLISPLIGAGFVAYIWTHLDSHSMTLGLIWTAAGAAYLIYLITVAKRDVGKMRMDDSEADS